MTRAGHLRTLKANGKGPRPNHSGQRRGPLRPIVSILRWSEGLFDSNYVELECGHRLHSNGTAKARCSFCANGVSDAACP